MIKESSDAGLFGFEEELILNPDKETKEETKVESKEDSTTIKGIDAEDFEKSLMLELEGENPDKEKDALDDEDASDEKEEVKTEEVKETKEDKKDKSNLSFKAIASYLDEEGIVSFEDSKDIEDSPELLIELVDKTVKSKVQEYKESLPDVVAELVEFIENGGNPEKFLEAVNKELDYESLDLEDESNQELIVREYLKAQDHSKEEIDELIVDYKEALVLEKHAKFATKKLEKIQGSRKEAVIKEQELALEDQRNKVEKYKSEVKETIFASTELAGLPVNKKEKEDFTKYLLEINPKTGLTKYQEAVSKNPLQTQVELAYIKYKEFDFSKVEKKAKSDAATEIRDRIFTKSEGTPKGKTKQGEGEANFEAFKAMFGRK